MEPTLEQVLSFYVMCLQVSSLFQNIELTRFDTRTKRIFLLIGQTIEVEILESGERRIR